MYVYVCVPPAVCAMRLWAESTVGRTHVALPGWRYTRGVGGGGRPSTPACSAATPWDTQAPRGSHHLNTCTNESSINTQSAHTSLPATISSQRGVTLRLPSSSCHDMQPEGCHSQTAILILPRYAARGVSLSDCHPLHLWIGRLRGVTVGRCG